MRRGPSVKTEMSLATASIHFFPTPIRDRNSLDTLARSKVIRQPPVDISCC